MNWFQVDLERNEKRAAKIKQNPDPRMPKSNALLYQMFANLRREQAKAWEEGKPFVYTQGVAPHRVLLACGVYPVHLLITSDRATQESKRYLDIYRASGLPENICDRIQVGTGMALSGDIPQASMIIESTSCDPAQQEAAVLARYFRCPVFCFDDDYESNEETLKDQVDQLKEFFDFIEENVPGARYDEKKLREIQERERIAQQMQSELEGIVKQVPSVLGGRDALRMGQQHLIEDPRYLDYVAMVRDELMEKANRGEPLVENEKLRIFWLVSAPFFYNPFSFLEKLGAVVPVYEAGGFASGHRRVVGDDKQYGRHLDLLEEEAAPLDFSSWRGGAENRVQAVNDVCREYKIDAIVHYNLSGCHTLAASAQIVAERAESELGIPSLLVDGYCHDAERFNQAEFEQTLGDFVQMCIERKGTA